MKYGSLLEGLICNKAKSLDELSSTNLDILVLIYDIREKLALDWI